MTEALSDAIREHFGVDIDGDTLRKGPEAIADVLEDAVRKAESDSGRKERKKTKKQLEKEERERQAQEFEKKSLRSLYLSLAKALHPDAEPDESAKEGKEKVMKDLTAAYEAGDLHSMLRIEMEWMDRESSDPRPQPEERLKAYLSALKEQARELEDELASLEFSPRYEPIQAYLVADGALGEKLIDEALREEKRRAKLLRSLSREFSGDMEKQIFIARVRELA